MAGDLVGPDPHDTVHLSADPGHQRAASRPGGFWVAKDDPWAADAAITVSCPVSELTGAVLLSKGASRIVDRFQLVHLVRQAEAHHAVAADDATIAHCTELDETLGRSEGV